MRKTKNVKKKGRKEKVIQKSKCKNPTKRIKNGNKIFVVKEINNSWETMMNDVKIKRILSTASRTPNGERKTIRRKEVSKTSHYFQSTLHLP